MRKIIITGMLLALFNLQGCATNTETFALGALVGSVVFSCSRNCY